jgi:hypothetical protein
MKEIKLTQGKVTLIDDEDYEYLNQWKWHLHDGHGAQYATRTIYRKGGKQRQINMHRLIMNTPNGMEVDHLDRNGLNNQKNNMRNCTRKENSRNRDPKSASGYIGVYCQGKSQIIARIYVNGKDIFLGSFKNKEDAARARDNAAKIYFGEFATINLK